MCEIIFGGTAGEGGILEGGSSNASDLQEQITRVGTYLLVVRSLRHQVQCILWLSETNPGSS